MKRVVICALAAWCCAGLPGIAPAVSAQTSEWLVLVYLAGDNNLDSAGLADIAEMEAAGRSDQVKVAVLMDRAADGDWTETRRFVVRAKEDLPEDKHSYDLTNDTCEVLGELNMGKPETLSGFLKWGLERFPAKHTMLVLWNHGGGWRDVYARAVGGARAADSPEAADAALGARLSRGIAWDDTDGSDFLETREVRGVLEQFPKLTVIGMDACLMAMAEVAFDLRARAEVMIASEELEPGPGWPYTEILKPLYKKPGIGAEEMGQLVVKAYKNCYKKEKNTTLSAVRLGRMDDLARDMDAVAKALMGALDATGAARPDFLGGEIPGVPKGSEKYRDLDGLLKWLQGRYGAAVDSALDKARATFAGIVIANYAHADHPLSGLSIFPGGAEAGDYVPDIIQWAQATQWDEMLAKVKAMPESPKAPTTRWAVLIGVNDYADPNVPDLKYATADVAYIKEALLRAGYSADRVLTLLDGEATLAKVRSTLGTWLPREAGEHDLVLIYFSGHGGAEPALTGATDDGTEKYMMLADSRVEDMYSTALPMSELSRIFSRIRSDKLLLAMDSCYSGASGGKGLLRAGMKAVGMSDSYLNQLATTEGTAILTASRASEISMESPELGHGVFTYHLGEALRGDADTDNDGVVTLSEVYQYVSSHVPATTKKMGASQNPVLKGELTGTFPLAAIQAVAAAPEDVPAPPPAVPASAAPAPVVLPVQAPVAIPAAEAPKTPALPAAPMPSLSVIRVVTRGEPEWAVSIHNLPAAGRDPSAWIGFYSNAAAPHADYLSYTFLKNLMNDVYTVSVPAEKGQYEFRLFRNGDYDCIAVSPACVVE